ncbi:MAG: ATP-binding protein [Phycisphaerales bacterium]
MNGNGEDATADLRAESRRHLTRYTLLAVGAVALIFIVYEVVERTWLTGVDMRVLHVLHMVRGIVASIAAAVLVGWSIARSSPPLLVSTPTEEELAQGTPPTEVIRITNHARWMIQMRWVALVVAVTLVFICTQAAGLLPAMLTRPLLLTLAALALLNVAYTLMLRARFQGRRLLHLQVYGDLVILVILLHFSGGIENPLSLIMVFHVIIGGIILGRLQCYLVAATGSLLFGVLALAEWGHVLEHYTLQIFPHFSDGQHDKHAAHESLYVASRVGLQTLILFVTAYFVSTLVARLRHDERQLEVMAARALADGQLLERSLETTGSALRVIDRSLRARWTNSRWRTWFGSGDTLEGEGSAVQDTFRDGLTRKTELTLSASLHVTDQDGFPESERILHVTTAPLRGAQGDVDQVVELARDVTEQRRSQARMLRAGQLAAVGELAGQVAHEVNNPIAIISAKARLLLSDHLAEMSDETAEEIDKIVHLSDRVADIAQGLLSYCRPSAAVREPLDIRDPVRRALAMVESRASGAGIGVEQDLPGDLPPVRANAQELEQVFLNLVLNALDAMPRGGTLTVRVEAAQRPLPEGGPAVSVVIQDTGDGIPDEIRQRVFEPFFTTKAHGRGTGLGLSICEGLVRSHGGRIDLDSSPSTGTRFTVTFPIEQHSGETFDHGQNADSRC